MSEKNNKTYRYVWRNLERNALEHYEYLSFFLKNLNTDLIKRNMLNGIVKIINSIILIWLGDKRKMKVIGAVTIGKLIEAHYEKDENKFKSYAEFIADAYNEMGEERAERIIRSRIDGSYKDKPVGGLDEVMEQGRMTKQTKKN